MSRKRSAPGFLLVEGGDGDERPSGGVAAEGAGERLAGEVEDAAVLADHEVAVTEADHAGDGFVEVRAAHGPPEGGVAEGEDAAVGGDEPVALPAAVGYEGLHRGVGEPSA